MQLLSEIAPDKYGHRRGRFRCHCEREFVSRIRNVESGIVKSCGCERAKANSKRFRASHNFKGRTVGGWDVIGLARSRASDGSRLWKIRCRKCRLTVRIVPTSFFGRPTGGCLKCCNDARASV